MDAQRFGWRSGDVQAVAGQQVSVIGPDPESPGSVLVRFHGAGHTARVPVTSVRQVSRQKEGAPMVQVEKEIKARSSKRAPTAVAAPAKSKPKSKARPAPKAAPWLDATDSELAALLLAKPTLADSSWSARAKGEVRAKGESRAAFIQRVLGA